MRALAAFHLAGGGFGQAQEVIEARTGVTVGRAQLAGLAEELEAWTGDFYAVRSRDADEEDQPDSDASARPGTKKRAETARLADSPPPAPAPEDIAAPPVRRKAHPGPSARYKWGSASVTESIEDRIGSAFDAADRRGPERV